MRLRSIACILTLFTALSALAQSPDPRLKNTYTFPKDGWTYVHLEGTPSEVGFQHGYLLADKIEDNYRVYKLEAEHESHRKWEFFREASRTVLWPNIDAEYKAELEGIAAGLKAHGSKLDLWDVVTINGDEELMGYYLPWLNQQTAVANAPKLVAPGKCSAFIATGSATKDGKIVIAHSNWSPYIEGERWTVIFDIVPTHGHHILMDGSPGMITSQDDFGINSAGLMITETTLPMAKGWNSAGKPEFMRSRKAMQYASSIDEYVAIMRDGNNGGYANSWLIGDRNTGEIAYLELGLKQTPLLRKKDGYFVSANFSSNPDLIRDDTPGFNPNNRSSSMNARHIRAEQFMKQHYGQLDATLAQAYLADHEDSFTGRLSADQRSLCGHIDHAKEGEPVWEAPPYEPSGAVTGKVADSTLAEKMSFIARAGHPCGEDFIAAPFLAEHPEFNWQKPVLTDMKAGPWSTFTAAQKPSASGGTNAAE